MLCDVCKCNDATVFLTQILEGKMHKVNLCEACSKEKGVQDPTSFALADLLLGIGAAEEIEKEHRRKNAPCAVLVRRTSKNRSPWLQRMLRDLRRGFGFAVKSDA